MVALSSLAGAGWQFFGNNGLPLAGGKLFTYAAGTTTPLATYTSSSGATPHANPIILDSAGRVPNEVWLTSSASYKFTLKTAANVEIWTKDNVPGIADSADLAAFIASLASSSGASLIGTPLGITQAAVDDSLIMMAPWIGAAGDGTDCTAVVNAYLATKTRLHFPARVGTRATSRYGITGPLLVKQSGTHISFDKGARLVPVGGVNPGGGIRIEGAKPTSWVSLSADFLDGTNTLTVATDPGWQIGDWLEIRSDALIVGCPNVAGYNKIGIGRKITARTGTGPVTFTLQNATPYNFLIADNAIVGKCTMIEDVVIDCAQINDEEFGANIVWFPFYLKYCANVTLINPTAYGSKAPYGPDDSRGDFIKIWNL
jgi:hypothetical protein